MEEDHTLVDLVDLVEEVEDVDRDDFFEKVEKVYRIDTVDDVHKGTGLTDFWGLEGLTLWNLNTLKFCDPFVCHAF